MTFPARAAGGGRPRCRRLGVVRGMETSALGRNFSGPQTHRTGADSAAPSNQAQPHRKHFLYVIGSGAPKERRRRHAVEQPRRATSDIDSVFLYVIGSGVPVVTWRRNGVEQPRRATSDIDFNAVAAARRQQTRRGNRGSMWSRSMTRFSCRPSRHGAKCTRWFPP
jgi:hypothetical protein